MSRLACAPSTSWFPWYFATGGGVGDPFGPSNPNPYGSPSFGTVPPPKQSKLWLWILLGVGGGLGLACCGCLGLSGAGLFGAGKVLSAAVKNQFQAHPVVQEQIGEIQSCEWNFMASTEETSKVPGSQIQVFDVKGSKGEGQIYGPQLPTASENKFLRQGTLRMKDGKTFDLGGE